MKSKATVNFTLLKNVTDKNGKSPLRLVIYDGKKRKRYGVSISITEDDWNKILEPKLKDPSLKKTRIEVDGIRVKAEETIAKLDPFTFEGFEKKFFNPEISEGLSKETPSLKLLFDQYISEKKENGQVGTYQSYQTTISSIETFREGILITEVNSTFLQDYEKHLISKGNSPSTIGIYMRQLRAIINRAIKDEILDIKNYPFRNFQIPTARNNKQALPEECLNKLFKYKTDNEAKQKALDFWIFSYLCNGMNFTDIAFLKRDNIDGNFLNFNRQKTIRTKKKDLTPIRMSLNPRAIEIIEKYKTREEGNPYLFPILEPSINALTIKNRCHRFFNKTNKQMRAIKAELGIDQPLNTYAARHSFSTILKRKGVSTSYIKEALGHSSESTTESYLASFTDDVKLKYSSLLTEFQVTNEVNIVDSDTLKRKRKKNA